LGSQHPVCFRRFSFFEKVKREERKVRHPQSGEMMTIPEPYTAKFNPSEELEEMVDGREGQ